MKNEQELRTAILAMDHRSYPAYKDLAGQYRFDKYILSIDHVQGDPFAAPSRLSVIVSPEVHAFKAALYDTRERRTAFEDALVRRFHAEAERVSFKAKGSGKSGLIGCSRPGQAILERSACVMNSAGLIRMRFEVGFPAQGRSINARELVRILFDFVPKIVENALICKPKDVKGFQERANLADDQAEIRRILPEMGLCAFVPDGAILPRESGVSQRPLKGAVPFTSPESLRVTLHLPHRGKVTGMGIRQGVTLIVGGGYHGKSTLLEALQNGVYPHIEGDGRELVVTDDSAVKLRAEDGRSIRKTDISLFINNLPNKADCKHFSTENASGSTSQAANTSEAIEAGAKTFLIDEDTCATNFMLRDSLMETVISQDQEPIRPFLAKVRDLYEKAGISTVLVAGSSGAFFTEADTIIQMDQYVPYDITERAKEEAKKAGLTPARRDSFALPSTSRYPMTMDMRDYRDRVKIKSNGFEGFVINKENVDLRYLEQLVDMEQVTALGNCLRLLGEAIFNGEKTLQQSMDELMAVLEKAGLFALADSERSVPAMAMPRRQEIFMMVNRYRGLQMK